MKIAIIGTAGRGNDADHLNLSAWSRMNDKARDAINGLKLTTLDLTVELVSGGAAWADHIAVDLFNNSEVAGLHLFLPSELDNTSKQFAVKPALYDPGAISNKYHARFSKAILRSNTIEDIFTAREKGAQITIRSGFKPRNTLVAEEAGAIIALTFGSGNVLKDGGTADTIRKYVNYRKQKKLPVIGYHVDLNNFTTHSGFVLPEP